MKRCRVCGLESMLATCSSCAEVAQLVQRIADPLCVIVDGSYSPEYAGAGLVLVLGPPNGEHIAFCACRFDARSSMEAEFQAIVRGRRWAPGVPVYSDCLNAIAAAVGPSAGGRKLSRMMAQHHQGVFFLHDEYREPNHGFAHRLSRQGRLEVRAAQRAKATGS